MRSGKTKSCGCLHREVSAASLTTHGFFVKRQRPREYPTWCRIKSVCSNPKNARYKDYGGRGIRACGRWHKFENFLQDMGPRPEGLSLGRINNDGDYEPSNCRWATLTEQARNKWRGVYIRRFSDDQLIKECKRRNLI